MSIEETFYKELDYTVKKIKEYEQERLDVIADSGAIKEQMSALSTAIHALGEDQKLACEAIRKEIQISSDKLRINSNRLQRIADYLTDYNKSLRTLQAICPHDDRDETYFDGHKGEQYYKCNRCGHEW